MKIKLLSELFNSTLSCILKCLRFSPMIHRKLILGLFILSSLSACTAPTAMLGPAYTLSTTGNVMQAGFSYGSSELVTMYTGKSPMDNLKKQTLESDDFITLVESRIKKTNSILKLSSQ